MAFIAQEGSPPKYLRYAFVTERHGSPFSSGWMDWPAGWLAKMEYCDLVYTTLSRFSADGVLPIGGEREQIVTDSMEIDKYLRTGTIDDNEYTERVTAYARILDG